MHEPKKFQDSSLQGWFEVPDSFQMSSWENINRVSIRSHAWRPPTDVYELNDVIIVRVEIAGMRENDFSISIQNRKLSIRGVRLDTPERRAYYQMEIRYGEFSSEVELPAAVVEEAIQAEYRSGFLTLTLPKQKPKQVQINSIKAND